MTKLTTYTLPDGKVVLEKPANTEQQQPLPNQTEESLPETNTEQQQPLPNQTEESLPETNTEQQQPLPNQRQKKQTK
ncbi:hypothetical protein FACS189443_7030 [Planctomycetales bacterium]|nr:hypothetical protein FACS189443_7030 [Planctomycetales bacterium]